ncbi:hypothetical protein [Oryzibacter oryziterrae]|uniref:hypothetical protein n=1 Tax=Oryzibacter oryziterrae TaxID=2766474 RepID=UPI001F45DE89|nr:hypothetical protein [Oryzibacter oryziterrae]
MTLTSDQLLLRRFARTVRVATATAFAEFELTAGRAMASAPIAFRALAAKGADGWSFPAAGLLAVDGLIHAALVRDADGRLSVLKLQARGVAGLDRWAGRAARVSFGPFGPDVDVAFDGNGAADVPLAGLEIVEEDLAAFDMWPLTDKT